MVTTVDPDYNIACNFIWKYNVKLLYVHQNRFIQNLTIISYVHVKPNKDSVRHTLSVTNVTVKCFQQFVIWRIKLVRKVLIFVRFLSCTLFTRLSHFMAYQVWFCSNSVSSIARTTTLLHIYNSFTANNSFAAITIQVIRKILVGWNLGFSWKVSGIISALKKQSTKQVNFVL